jgi:hypothetical protein
MELMVRYVAAFPLVAASLIGSASECAKAQSNPYALDRLFLESSDATPLDEVLSFNSETEVAKYYGADSNEASLATEFYANGGTGVANMLFARYPVLPARAHLYGGNVSNLTLAQLQAINGSLSITSEGYKYAGSLDLAGVTSLSAAATAIEKALNKNLPVAAMTTGSSISPVSVSFTGSIDANTLHVTALPSGTIQIGSMITVPGYRTRDQVSAQLSGTPGGVGVYSLFLHGLSPKQRYVPPETLEETYGVLTVGSTSSGTVAVGQQVTNGRRGSTNNVLPHTSIEAQLSANTWVVDEAQSVTSENMTMTGAPLSVRYAKVEDGTESSGHFLIQQWPYVNFVSSSLTYMGGTAAGALDLTQKSGGFLSPTGEIVTSPSAWMDSFVANYSDEFSSFQTEFNQIRAIPPGERDALADWAKTTDGHYTFLYYSVNTPPIVDSMDLSVERLAATAGATAPEPSTWAMVLIGIVGLGLASRRAANNRIVVPAG